MLNLSLIHIYQGLEAQAPQARQQRGDAVGVDALGQPGVGAGGQDGPEHPDLDVELEDLSLIHI